MHIGHAVVLRKLQQFVDAGHDVTLLIGDFTARIGDPTGRNTMRPPLTDEAIAANMQTYAKQAGKVLDMERITLRYNSEWLSTISFAQLIKLLAQTTVARMLDRNDFADRYAAGTPISMHEFLYPVAQAYDSIALEADVELGGSDQLFNLLMGRPYQLHAGQPAQICLTVPLLEGLDGKQKMSKSTGNHIALTDPPERSVRQGHAHPGRSAGALRPARRRLVGRRDRQPRARRSRRARATRWTRKSVSPRRSSRCIMGPAPPGRRATTSNGRSSAANCRRRFRRAGSRARARWSTSWSAAGFADSKRAAQRLIAEGAVKIDGSVVTDPKAVWDTSRPAVLQVGSRKFIRVLTEKG